VLSVIPANNQQHAVDIANDTIYGLNAAVFTPDIAHASQLASKLRSDTCGARRPHVARPSMTSLPRERGVQRTSKRLRYNLNRHYLGVVAWMESLPEQGDVQLALGEALGSPADCAGRRHHRDSPDRIPRSRRMVESPKPLRHSDTQRDRQVCAATVLPPLVCLGVGVHRKGYLICVLTVDATTALARG
jgi:hypothetical protein